MNREKMYHVLNVLDSRRFDLAVSLIVSLILTGISFLFFKFYHTSDDIIMIMLASGSGFFEQSSQYLIFSSPGWGFLLQKLYILNRDIEWYALILNCLIFFSNVTLLYLILKRSVGLEQKIINTSLFCIYYFSFGILFNIELHYSLVASYISFSAALLLVYGSLRSFWNWLVVIILTLFAVQIRRESCVLSYIIVLGTCIVALSIFRNRVQKMSLYSGSVLVLFLMTLFCALMSYYEDIQYPQEYIQAKEYNWYGALASNYSYIERMEPQVAKDILESVGWNWNDYELFKRAFYEHPLFNINNAKDVFHRSLAAKDTIKIQFIPPIIEAFGILYQKWMIVYWLFVIGILLCVGSSKELLLLIVLQILGFILFFWVLSVWMKAPPFRIYYSWFCIIPLALLIHRAPNSKLNFSKNSVLNLVGLLSLIGVVFFKQKTFIALSRSNEARAVALNRDIDLLRGMGEDLIFFRGASIFQGLSAFDISKVSSKYRNYSIGLLNMLPEAKQLVPDNELGCLSASLIKDSPTRIVLQKSDNFIPYLIKFVKDHHGVNAAWVIDYQFEEFLVGHLHVSE